jgi:hypothetical protein
MKQIQAFKCEHTGRVFEHERDARRSELRAKLRAVAEALPSSDLNTSSYELMSWLADKLEGGTYQGAAIALRDAVSYLFENKETIEKGR